MSTAATLTNTDVTTRVEGQTAIVTLNRPSVLNALNRNLLAALKTAFEEIEKNDEIKGVVLTGAGEKAFAAGADISEISVLSREEALAFSRAGQRLFSYIERFPKPVFAAVNGFALGAGCELAMSCHMRLASSNAKFGQPEVNLGVIAGYGGTQRLPRIIGSGRALELLLTGDMFDAATAQQFGLANHVTSQEELLPATLKLIEKTYLRGPLALQYTIEAVFGGLETPATGYDLEAALFAKAVNSEDCKEGTSAFLEKRKPAFRGN